MEVGVSKPMSSRALSSDLFIFKSLNFIFDFLNEIIRSIASLPQVVVLLGLFFLIYQPELIADINRDYIMMVFQYIHDEFYQIISLFLSFVLVSLFLRYLLGYKKFVLGNVLINAINDKANDRVEK